MRYYYRRARHGRTFAGQASTGFGFVIKRDLAKKLVLFGLLPSLPGFYCIFSGTTLDRGPWGALVALLMLGIIPAVVGIIALLVMRK